MNYPYGDLINFTDNTPFLFIISKGLDMLGIPMDHIALPFYHYFFLFNILLSTYLTYRIGCKFVKSKWLLFVAALTLPWICPQLFRLTVGNMNLSLSSLILLVMYFNLGFLEKRDSKDKKKYLLYLSLVIFISGWFHIYYVPMLILLCFPFGMYYLISRFRSKKLSIRSWLFFFIPTLSGLLYYSVLRLIDPQEHLRKNFPEGYNWDPYNFQWDGLMTPLFDPILPSIFSSDRVLHFESHAYVGAFVLFALTTMLIAKSFFWIKNRMKPTLDISTENSLKIRHLILPLFLSGAFCLFVSVGEQMQILFDQIKFDNIINPLFWLSKFDDSVRQFRMLARFSTPFFWSINFLALYFLDLALYRFGKYKTFVLLAATFILILDAVSAQRFLKNHQVKNFLHSSAYYFDLNELDALDFNDFQAILPIPFYHVGSENLNYVLDPEDNWCTMTYQFALHSKLPLMASKMSRTPVAQNIAIIEMLQTGRLTNTLKVKMDAGKHILIIESKNVNHFLNVERQPVGQANERSKTFTEGKQLIFENTAFKLYSWPVD